MKQINEILEDLTDKLKDTLIKSYIEDIYKLKEENKKLILSYNNLKLNHDNLIKLYDKRLNELNDIKKNNKICKKYLHNHERDYVDKLGNLCCKPSKYFNIAWAQDILDGDIEGFEELLIED